MSPLPSIQTSMPSPPTAMTTAQSHSPRGWTCSTSRRATSRTAFVAAPATSTAKSFKNHSEGDSHRCIHSEPESKVIRA
jgi:hypothetical protein